MNKKSADPLERVSALAACCKGGDILEEVAWLHPAGTGAGRTRAVDMDDNCLYCNTQASV